MEIAKASNFGNPHIGLFAKASEKAVIVDSNASEKLLFALSALGVPLRKSSFGGASGLSGIYLSFNSKGAIVPSFCEAHEKKNLQSLGLEVGELSGNFCAAGNNICANDFGAIANPSIKQKEIRMISDCLGVEVVQMRIAGYSTPGSAILATNKGFLAHNRCSEEELKEIESVLRVRGTNATLNKGVAFPSLGALANSKGAVFGEACTGFEIGRAAQWLGMQ